MAKSAWFYIGLVALCLVPQAAFADISFVAVQQVNDDWDFGLYTNTGDGKPEASGDANIVSGLEMYWELTYDGSGMLTYSWGTSADTLGAGIDYNLGPIDFDYLYVAALSKPNNKPTAAVQDLVLQTDAGILKAETLESGWGNNNSHQFAFNDLAIFGSFTLSGSTTFTWNGKGSNSNNLAVVITGGNSSPVVDEPMSAALLLIGVAALGLRSIRKKRAGELVPVAG